MSDGNVAQTLELLLPKQLTFPLEDCRCGLTGKPLVGIVYFS